MRHELPRGAETTTAEAPLTRVLVVDDEEGPRRLLCDVVRKCAAAPDVAGSVAEARALLEKQRYACALIDKNLGNDSGIDLLALIREKWPETDAIIITGYPNVASAVEAMRLGAADYFSKPFEVGGIIHRLKVVLERRALVDEHRHMPTLIHTDRMATLGRMSAGLAHELNNPLSYVTGHLELAMMTLQTLRAQGGDPVADLCDKLGASLEDAQSGAQRIRALISELRSFSRASNGADEAVDPHKAVDAAITLCAHELKHRAKVHRSFTATRRVVGDHGRLMQVFTNLLVNAAQALPHDGYARNEISVTSRDSDGGVAIEVHDNGCGIPEELLPRLFEPFFTTKPQGLGTGLGLSICRSIVERSGGRIEVESTPGMGSTFRVVLREAAAPALTDS